MLYLAPAIVMSMIGCATVLSDPPPPELVCPAIIQYSPEFLNQVADARDMLAKDNPLRVILQDYQQERDKLRVCEKGIK